jgi:hypothetical protein
MYLNAKVVPVETVPLEQFLLEGWMKESTAAGDFKYDIFDTL